jgi:uncharacterized membrane protein
MHTSAKFLTANVSSSSSTDANTWQKFLFWLSTRKMVGALMGVVVLLLLLLLLVFLLLIMLLLLLPPSSTQAPLKSNMIVSQ